jgi:hypothetical protein
MIPKPKTNMMIKRIMKMINKILEISADIAATLGSPKAPAIKATTKNISAHVNINTPFFPSHPEIQESYFKVKKR